MRLALLPTRETGELTGVQFTRLALSSRTTGTPLVDHSTVWEESLLGGKI